MPLAVPLLLPPPPDPVAPSFVYFLETQNPTRNPTERAKMAVMTTLSARVFSVYNKEDLLGRGSADTKDGLERSSSSLPLPLV